MRNPNISPVQLKKVIARHIHDKRVMPSAIRLKAFCAEINSLRAHYDGLLAQSALTKLEDAIWDDAASLYEKLIMLSSVYRTNKFGLDASLAGVTTALQRLFPLGPRRRLKRAQVGRPKEEWHLIARSIAYDLQWMLGGSGRQPLSVDNPDGPIAHIGAELMEIALSIARSHQAFASAVKAPRQRAIKNRQTSRTNCSSGASSRTPVIS
jgi:hypothetical protein